MIKLIKLISIIALTLIVFINTHAADVWDSQKVYTQNVTEKSFLPLDGQLYTVFTYHKSAPPFNTLTPKDIMTVSYELDFYNQGRGVQLTCIPGYYEYPEDELPLPSITSVWYADINKMYTAGPLQVMNFAASTGTTDTGIRKYITANVKVPIPVRLLNKDIYLKIQCAGRVTSGTPLTQISLIKYAPSYATWKYQDYLTDSNQ